MTNIKHIIIFALLAIGLLSATSCSMMHDDMSDCQQELRVAFKYDMNMKFADAFEGQVRMVTLYAYDHNGNLVLHKTEPTSDIKARGGYMVLDGLKSGRYTLQAWAEGDVRHDNSYTYGAPTSNAQSIRQLTCRINRDSKEISHDITPLYHGLLTDADLTIDGYGAKMVTMPLTKDTNVIRVVLQNASGEKLNADDFSFFIDDDNTWLAYDNSPIEDGGVTYRPWSKYDGIAGGSRTDHNIDNKGDTPVSAVVAELTVCRLLTQNSPRLRVVGNNDGKTIFSIPLNDYALLVKGNYNRSMSDQEYLDRQDEYNFVFFIDNNHNWLSTSILINSWRVVLHNTGV